MKYVQEFLNFINESPTAFHAIANMKKDLLAHGYQELDETKSWQLEKGAKYFVIRNASSLVAFHIGNNIQDYKFNIIATHSDSPSFRLKPNGIINKNNYLSINTEPYGGAVLSTWFDRPLSVAGRIFVNENSTIKEQLVDIKHSLLVIPSVASNHFRMPKNDLNPQVDLLPVFAIEDQCASFDEFLAQELKLTNAKIMSSDLFLYNKERGTIIGKNQEMLLAPQIDNLECGYCCLVGFEKSQNDAKISLYACFNNEEVGSSTYNGAKGTFLLSVLKRINNSLGKNEVEFEQALANSKMISADNAHGLHPNHPELTDPTNSVYLNKGVVIKFNANQKYTTDASGYAWIKMLCEQENIPYQVYTNRSDQGGGSTLGCLAVTVLGIPTVDIGLAQLAMHSAMETTGCADLAALVKLSTKFFEQQD